MFVKIFLVVVLLAIFIVSFVSFLGYSINRTKIERLEEIVVASQEQEQEIARQFKELAKESKQQAESLGVVQVAPIVITNNPKVEDVVSKKSFWASVSGFLFHSNRGFVVDCLSVVVISVVVLCVVFRRKIGNWWSNRGSSISANPVIIFLIGTIMVFSLAGSVWAVDEKKPSVYAEIYKIMKNQGDSIGKMSVWQDSFVSSQAILDQAKKYTDQKIAGLPKVKITQKPAVVEKKEISVVRVEKPKPDFSNFAQQKPNVNQLWGEQIIAEQSAKKAVEVGLQQIQRSEKSKPQACALVTPVAETAEQKIKRLEQEKAQIELRLKDSECQVRTLQEKDITSVSEKEKDKKCRPARFLVGGRIYR